MVRPRSLALILAGGAGGRLELLTQHRAKPAVPYAGTHRLIDIPLSACADGGFDDVWVMQQSQPASLSDHLSNGRPWDLDRTSGGLLVLQPSQGTGRDGFTSGTADGLWQRAPLIRQAQPEVLVLMSADAAYRLDLDALVQEHRASGKALTAVTAPVPEGEQASRFGVVTVEGDQVTSYAYKPDEPASDTVTTEVFICDPQAVLDLLEELDSEVGEEGLNDFGDGLLPRLCEQGEMRAAPIGGYWRDLGTVASYWRGHQELLGEQPAFRLHDELLPIRTHHDRADPARLLRGAQADDSLLGPGCCIAGTVQRSVLAAGVLVEAGATVRDSVLLPGAVVRSGAVVECAVLDDGAEVGAGAYVGEGAGEVTLLGKDVRVPPEDRVPAGSRRPDSEQ